MPAQFSSNQIRGFTLVEVLIGMTLLSLIMLLLFSSLHTVGKSWTLTENKIYQTDEYRIAANFIKRQLHQTVPLLWASNDAREVAFRGSRNEINFTGTLPSHRGGGGLHLLTIKLVEQDKQQNLVLQYQSAISGGQSFEVSNTDLRETTVIAENISKLEFSYFGSAGAEKEEKWMDEWNITEQLPRMVRVNIAGNEHGQNWPAMQIVIYPRYVNGQRQFMQYPQG